MRHNVFDRFSSNPSGFPIDFLHVLLEPEVQLGDYSRIKCVRLDDISAGFKIVPMNFLNNVRAGKTEDLVIVFEVDWMMGKASASIILLLKLELLDHRPERTIEDQDPLLECINDIE